MHAITIKQPWAYAICHLDKRVENRKRKPPENLIGQRVAIHAGVAFDDDATDWMFARGLMRSVHMTPEQSACFDARGAVVATAVLRGHTTGDGNITTLSFDRPGLVTRLFPWKSLEAWFTGPVGHVLADVRVLATPIPCRGQLGYWTLPDEVAAEIERQGAA